jgi:hypothetical protein
MPTTTEHQQMTKIVDVALTSIGDQAYLTQSRCVDVLLDLFQATNDPFTRWSIADRLSDIRFIGTVPGDVMRSSLAAIVEITAAADHNESAWCDWLAEACDSTKSSLFVEAG